MNKIIQLENTAMDFKALAGSCQQLIFNIKGARRWAFDFGTVLQLDDRIAQHPTVITLIEGLTSHSNELETVNSPLFSAPMHWRMPHILRALGAFKSAMAAMSNGWGDVPEGWTEHSVRINNIKGVVCTFRVTEDNPLFTECMK